MAVIVDIEKTNDQGDLGRRADYAVTITAGEDTFEFDVEDLINFREQPIFSIFLRLKEHDPEALAAIATNYDEDGIKFNGEKLNQSDTIDALEICRSVQTLAI